MFAPRSHRILAFATSLILHLLVAFAAIRQAPPAERREPSPPKAMITFVVPRADDPNFLFPFLTPGLSLDHLVVEPESAMLERLANLLASQRTARHTEAANRPLAVGGEALQTLTDKSWSRRHRWRAFQPILELADTHSADAGELPALLQRYRQQNSLQPYDDAAIPDPRVWAELELAADHVDFIAVIRRSASEHSSTRAATELIHAL